MLTPVNRATLLHAKLTILLCPLSIITTQRTLVDSKLLHRPRNVGYYQKSKKLNGVIKPLHLSTNPEILVKIGPLDSEPAGLRRRPLKKLKNKKTRNAWQSLAYSPLGAVVSPPSKYL